jgi:hypothetical protein
MPEPTPVGNGTESEGEGPLHQVDTTVPSAARIYDYLLGGKDHFAIDREAAEAVLAALPGLREGAKANRAFLGRAVRHLAAEAGIRQFLDIGTGIPTGGNTHEVAQEIAPESRIVYVDNDPMVLSHARALLTSAPAGKTAYLDADLRDTGQILNQASATIDFSQPVAVMLIAILHFVPDEEALAAVSMLMRTAAPGSFLAIAHFARDIEAESVGSAVAGASEVHGSGGVMPRSKDEVARFFEGLDLVDPGIVPFQDWRPDGEARTAGAVPGWAGVARKPA